MQSIALLSSGQCRWQRCEMGVSTNNGMVNGLVYKVLMPLFVPGSSKIKVFESCFSDVVPTQNDHSRYVKHILGPIYVFFTLFG